MSKKRTTITIDPKLHEWFKESSDVSLSRFVHRKILEMSASVAKEESKKIILKDSKNPLIELVKKGAKIEWMK